jgi:hypothetical protein
MLNEYKFGAEVGDAIHSTSASHRNPLTLHAVDNTDWL